MEVIRFDELSDELIALLMNRSGSVVSRYHTR